MNISTNNPQFFWIGVGVLWIFSAAVSAMDAPRADDSRFYRWLYRFTHLLAANLDRAFGATINQQTTEKQ
ncbi:MAG TPA: hypothetical protein VFA02_04055 [Pseudacidobacterium sp.]|nr:hypothetical protein [Pseudacidobacterium sp.]